MTHTHFIGIGGTGLSAIARVLLERGQMVSGSDQQGSALSESIKQDGATVYIGHKAEQIQGADIVVRSTAVLESNVEVVAAKAAGIPVVERVDYLKDFMSNQSTIAIAGSHGKTTTTAMAAWMLTALNQHPSFIVGGEIENLGTNAHAGRGQVFVIEADEYGNMFWGLTPKIAVITNIEHDHPDFFPTADDYMQAFKKFIDGIPEDGNLIICLDDSGAKELLGYAQTKTFKTLTYSISNPKADYIAKINSAIPGAGNQFTFIRGRENLCEVALQVPGRHNVLNATAALIIADLLKLNLADAALALGDFQGAGRRFDILGKVEEIVFIDDYGHHPTEIKATLSAAKERYPGQRIWAVWQPHTYSRTFELLSDYRQAFSEADQVLMTKVYAAREEQPDNFTHQNILDAIEHPQIRLTKELDKTSAYLLKNIKPKDIVIVFSAGNANQVSAQVYKSLQ
ncbi:MAG: UDP-N-acetylmuramate--L-alanine ligase, partial [Chloroflexota bacterium]